MEKQWVVAAMTGKEKAAFMTLCERRGMLLGAALSRLILWFLEQPEVIQADVLGQLDRDMLRILARQELERRGDAGEPPQGRQAGGSRARRASSPAAG